MWVSNSLTQTVMLYNGEVVCDLQLLVWVSVGVCLYACVNILYVCARICLCVVCACVCALCMYLSHCRGGSEKRELAFSLESVVFLRMQHSL